MSEPELDGGVGAVQSTRQQYIGCWPSIRVQQVEANQLQHSTHADSRVHQLHRQSAVSVVAQSTVTHQICTELQGRGCGVRASC